MACWSLTENTYCVSLILSSGSTEGALSDLKLLLDALNLGVLLLKVGFVVLLEICDDVLASLNALVVLELLLFESLILSLRNDE